MRCLNAPDGAGCSLTGFTRFHEVTSLSRLNAPDGAGCSLTEQPLGVAAPEPGLNAPDGAGCSLTHGRVVPPRLGQGVLMHLMVLGAP